MRRIFITCVLSFIMYACSDSSKLPEGVLSRPKMREVIWDMTRAGEFLNGFVFNKDSTIDKISETQKWYDKIYRLHKITKAEFTKSYTYYQDHPMLMKEILDSLAKREVAIRSVPIEGSTIKDSTKNKQDSMGTKDTLHRRSIDSFRKIIRKGRILNKPV